MTFAPTARAAKNTKNAAGSNRAENQHAHVNHILIQRPPITAIVPPDRLPVIAVDLSIY